VRGLRADIAKRRADAVRQAKAEARKLPEDARREAIEAALVRSCDGAPLAGQSVAFLINSADVGTATTNDLGIAAVPFAGAEALGAGAH